MLIKISIVVIYIFALFRFLVKWKKCSFILQGNEMLLMQAVVPLVLLLPGSLDELLPRLSLYNSVFGICFFWHLLFPKMAGSIMKSALVTLTLISLSEVAFMVYPWCSGRVFYSIAIIVVLLFFHITCNVKCEEEKFLRSVLNLGKLRKALIAGSLPVLVGVCVMGLYCLSGRNCYVGWIMFVMVSFLPLGYIYTYKPACWNYDELAQLKRKAYLLGKAINKDGHYLEDEGGIINESMVEDTRILYRIMKLFEEEKIYRNYEIKIGEVAKRIGTNKTYLSRVLNTRVSKNFCQFVNYYRIREICMYYIKDTKKEIRSLSEQSGFSSQSNFSIVFKYNTGYTPGDWCRIVKSKLERNETVDVDDYLL